MHERNEVLGCVPSGGSGFGFVIQDHSDHGTWKNGVLDELSGNSKKCAILRLVYALGLLSSSLNGSSNCTVFQLALFIKSTFFHDKLKCWNLNRSKYWLRYGDRGTLNACDQWPIDLTLQTRFYFVFIAEFVERLPTIFPSIYEVPTCLKLSTAGQNDWFRILRLKERVGSVIWKFDGSLIWKWICLFEIEHRWAKWLISDPSPKGTRWISDLKIWWITDQKSWSGFSQRNAPLEVWCIKIIQSGAAYLYRTRTRVDHFSKNNQCGMQKSSHSFAEASGESPSEGILRYE